MKKILAVVVFVLLGTMSFAQWAVNGTHIYNTNSGNVGIGISAPAYVLDVQQTRVEPKISITNKVGGTGGAAFRMYDSSYSSSMIENGGKSIKFFGQNGAIEIVPSIYVKEGYAFVISLEDFCRVGSTDVTFKRPGQGDNFFRDMEDSAGYELRCYTDQALFCAKPGKNILISNLKTV